MPNAPDKIIINDNRDTGGNRAISCEFESLKELGKEIMHRGLERQTNTFRDEMRVACQKYNKAQAEYLKFLRDFTDRLSLWLDDQP